MPRKNKGILVVAIVVELCFDYSLLKGILADLKNCKYIAKTTVFRPLTRLERVKALGLDDRSNGTVEKTGVECQKNIKIHCILSVDII